MKKISKFYTIFWLGTEKKKTAWTRCFVFPIQKNQKKWFSLKMSERWILFSTVHKPRSRGERRNVIQIFERIYTLVYSCQFINQDELTVCLEFKLFCFKKYLRVLIHNNYVYKVREYKNFVRFPPENDVKVCFKNDVAILLCIFNWLIFIKFVT